MVTSFSIKPSDAENIKLIIEIKKYCLSQGLNFSAFVLIALCEHFKSIKAKNNEFK